MGVVRRGEVYWVNLDPTVGTEIRKTRPGLVISPDDMNVALPRVIVAPLTSKGQPLGCRPAVEFGGKQARTCSTSFGPSTNAGLAAAWAASTLRYGIRCWWRCWDEQVRASGECVQPCAPGEYGGGSAMRY